MDDIGFLYHSLINLLSSYLMNLKPKEDIESFVSVSIVNLYWVTISSDFLIDEKPKCHLHIF